MYPESNDDEAGQDLLVSDDHRWGLGHLLPVRWRRPLALAAALAIGLAVGGYAGYAWPDSSERSTSDDTGTLTARISGLYALELPYPPYRLGVELRNDGSRPMTVERAGFDVPGFAASLLPSDVRPIRPGESETLFYGVRPVCDGPSPAGAGEFRLRVRGEAPGSVRSVTLRSPVAGTGVPAGYAILCRQPPPGLSVVAETLEVQRDAERAEGQAGLSVRVRLTATAGAGQEAPDNLRMLRTEMRVPGLAADERGGGGQPALPATIAVDLDIDDCADARQAIGDPRTLEVALLSEGTASLLYAHTDAEFDTALREYVAGRCGAGR